MQHWKTTANGILAFLIATLTTLTAFQVPAALVPQSDKTWLYITLGLNLALALCRVWVGLLQNDAPTTPPAAPPAAQ
jgi:fluoride ion exporter CrcB/FEX